MFHFRWCPSVDAPLAGMDSNQRDWKTLTPLELLEATGQHEPPVQLRPILKRFEIDHEFREKTFASTDGHKLFLPRPTHARTAGINLAIAHDLRQVQLGIPGGADDRYAPWLREQEDGFDRWGRELILPAAWFRKDALDSPTVKGLAARYNVRALDVIDRSQDLELTHLICRDKESYAVYCSHDWWKSRRTAYFATHQRCEQTGCQSRARFLHHLKSGYGRLGRELDVDLCAVCPTHHHGVHPDKGQLELFA